MSANTFHLKAFLSGNVIPIEKVKDPVFSTKMLGEGLAIEPTICTVLAPCDGIISMTMPDTKHAIGISAANGMELLIHIGLDTVRLKGKGFQLFVKKGDSVKTGDKLLQFDSKLIQEKGFLLTSILTVLNSEHYPTMKLHTDMEALAGENIIIEI